MVSNARTKRSFAETGPSSPVVDSVRVDEVTPGAKAGMNVRLILAILVAFIMLIPVFWMAFDCHQIPATCHLSPPKVFFAPLPGMVSSAYLRIERSCQPALWRHRRRGPT